jgi:GNAT superfamily N-acetyltransferase
LGWRVEATCLRAWPALSEIESGDWVLRFGKGLTRRANSANPVREPASGFDTVLARCRELYPAIGLPVVIRVPSIIDAGIDRRLDDLGFKTEGASLVMHAPIANGTGESDPTIVVMTKATPTWLSAQAELRALSARDADVFATIVSRIRSEAGFAAVVQDGKFVSLGFAVISDGLVCFEAVITHPNHRSRGLASRLVSALLAWAKLRGARDACLQVEAGNSSALSVYRRLGFETIHAYHYRRQT